MWQIHVNIGPLRLATFRLPDRPTFVPADHTRGEIDVSPNQYAELGILDDGGKTTFTVAQTSGVT